jgi:isopropylmalate/homocitrate/citramalate synthase
VLGKKSGAASVEAKLREIGLDATNEQVQRMLEAVKLEAIRTKHPLDNQQFAAIASSILDASGIVKLT